MNRIEKCVDRLQIGIVIIIVINIILAYYKHFILYCILSLTSIYLIVLSIFVVYLARKVRNKN